MSFKEFLTRAKISRFPEVNTLEIDLGEAPMQGPAALLFPTGTVIRIEGVEQTTNEGEEFAAREWCSGLDVTWGHLALPDSPYFKALDYPQEVKELQNLENSPKE